MNTNTCGGIVELIHFDGALDVIPYKFSGTPISQDETIIFMRNTYREDLEVEKMAQVTIMEIAHLMKITRTDDQYSIPDVIAMFYVVCSLLQESYWKARVDLLNNSVTINNMTETEFDQQCQLYDDQTEIDQSWRMISVTPDVVAGQSLAG